MRLLAAMAARVDNAHVWILHQRHRLTGTLVGQTEEHDVGRIDKAAPLVGVVALVLVDAQQLQVISGAYAVENLQACRASLTVDVHLCLRHRASSASCVLMGSHCIVRI